MIIIKIGELLSVRTENCVEPDQSPRTDWKCRLSSAEKIWGPKDMQNSLVKDKEICNGWKRSKITKGSSVCNYVLRVFWLPSTPICDTVVIT